MEKKFLALGIFFSSLSITAHAASGSFDSICADRRGEPHKSQVINYINIGDDDSANIFIAGKWSHVDHQLVNLQSLIKFVYFLGSKVDVCFSASDGRVLLIQTELNPIPIPNLSK